MANQTISSPETFTTALRNIETTDLVHPTVLNPLFGTLINNEAYLNDHKVAKGCTWGDLKNASTS